MQRLSARQVRTIVGAFVAFFFLRWLLFSSSRHPPESLDANHHAPPDSAAHSKWTDRAERVKQSFIGAYGAYEKSAYPADELLPLAEEGSNNLNGWGLTVVDSIGTMHLMGLVPEYKRAVEHVRKMRMADTRANVPFFETNIRYLGGLLSAYALTSEQVFLSRADELGLILLPAVSSQSGLPFFYVNPSTREAKVGPNGRKSSFSETTSFTLEFSVLARLSGRKEYAEAATRVTNLLDSTQPESGLWSTSWDVDSLTALNYHWAVGGNADSGYEYLLKQWLSDPSSKASRDMYIRASNAMIHELLYISPKRHLLYATDIPNYTTRTPAGKLEHLTCFLPGLLALGVYTLHEHLTLRQRRTHMFAAEGLAQTCWLLSADSPSGLAPDEVVFSRWPKTAGQLKDDPTTGRWSDILAEWEKYPGKRKGGIWGAHDQAERLPPGVRDTQPVKDSNERDYWLRRPENGLRPEIVESMFILWKTTHDQKWRERGWSVCEAMEKNSHTPSGAFSTVRRVDSTPLRFTDSMPSWFLAETLKYCFLLASNDDLVPLNRFVFNTEGHPLPRWGWDGWKKKFPKAYP